MMARVVVMLMMVMTMVMMNGDGDYDDDFLKARTLIAHDCFGWCAVVRALIRDPWRIIV